MSRTANALKIVQLLIVHKKMTCKEIVQILEVSERMVRTYIKDLEQAGIYVETVYGRYGGYVLDKESCKCIIDITKNSSK